MYECIKRRIDKHRFTWVRVFITVLASFASCIIASHILLFANELDFGQIAGVMIATLVALLGICVTAYVFVYTSAGTDGSSYTQYGASGNPFRRAVLRLFQWKLGLIVVLVLVCVILSLIAAGMPSSGAYGDTHEVQNIISKSVPGLLPFDTAALYRIGGTWSALAMMADVVMIVISSSYVWAVITYRKRMVGIALWQEETIEAIFSKGEKKRTRKRECSRESFERVLKDILSICPSRLLLPPREFDFDHIAKRFWRETCFETKSEIIGWYIRFLERYIDACREADSYCIRYSWKGREGNWKLVLAVAEEIWSELLVNDFENEDSNPSSVNVREHDFSKSSFRGARMAGSTFLECEFSDTTNFAGANMERCDFHGSTFTSFEIRSKSDLRESKNHSVTFLASRFDRALMTHAKICGNGKNNECPLSHSVFTEANLNGFLVEKTKFCGCSFAKASLHESAFFDARIDNTEFVEARMTSAKFRNSKLSECNMRDALLILTRWCASRVDNTSFEGASFIGAKIRSMKFQFGYCSRAVFQNSKIKKTIFKRSVLKDADFTGAELLATKFVGTQIDGALFRFCSKVVSRCKFVDCSAMNTSFMGSIFENCIFQRTSFVSGSFQGCTFRNCRFIECDLQEVRFDASSICETYFINCFNVDLASYGGTTFMDAYVHIRREMHKSLSDALRDAKSWPKITYLEQGEWLD